MTITIRKSPTADTRTCDFANVSKETLLASSQQHIGDIHRALSWMCDEIVSRSDLHDHDKITGIDQFHEDFLTGFKQTTWWDNHRKVNRHHLMQEDGIPDNVDLFDVLDFIADCCMAGLARSGSVYPLHLPDELLQRAFQNTVQKLIKNTQILEDQK